MLKSVKKIVFIQKRSLYGPNIALNSQKKVTVEYPIICAHAKLLHYLIGLALIQVVQVHTYYTFVKVAVADADVSVTPVAVVTNVEVHGTLGHYFAHQGSILILVGYHKFIKTPNTICQMVTTPKEQ